MDIGQASLDLGLAYRGIFPGRDETEIASLIAQTPAAALANVPFAPFYGSNYAELSLYLEKTERVFHLHRRGPRPSMAERERPGEGEVYVGDVTIFAQVQAFAGDASGEFNTIALATGFPGLEVWTGVQLSF